MASDRVDSRRERAAERERWVKWSRQWSSCLSAFPLSRRPQPRPSSRPQPSAWQPSCRRSRSAPISSRRCSNPPHPARRDRQRRLARRPAATPASGGSSGPAAVPGGPPNAPYTPENEVHLLDRLAVLYRYRRLCVTVFILVTAAMIIQGYSAVKVYQAQARLLIEDERSTAVPGLQNDQNTFYEDPEPYLPDAVQDPQGPRPDAPGRPQAAPGNSAGVQRHQPAPPTPTSLLSDLKTRVIGYFGRRRRRSRAETAQDRRDAGRVGAGRQLHRPRRRRAGPRHATSSTSRSSREEPKFAAERGEHADRRIRRPKTSRSSCGRRRACSTGWAPSSRPSRRRSRTASARWREYREKENALSLDDKQNIVLSRLNQLNDTADPRAQRHASRRNRSTTRSRRSPPAPTPTRSRSSPATRACRPRAAKLGDLQRREGAAARALRRQASAGDQHQRPAAGRAEAARHRHRRRGAVGPQRVRNGGDRGADASRRTSKAPRAKPPTSIARASATA